MSEVGQDPVVVVGAGLAGLCCALHLQRRGVPVRVFEAEDEPGGVVRTERREGFALDRGFQVLQTAYPEARAVLDYPALDLHPFRPGALIRWRGRLRRVGDPFRRPQDALATLASGIPSPADAARVLALRASVRSRTLEEILTAPAESTLDALRRRGFSSRMIEGFFRPFYRGVFLEPELATSSRAFEFTFRMFSSGDVSLPAGGIDAIPRQLAGRLAQGTLTLGAPVEELDGAGVRLASGERVAAGAVVVATDGSQAARFLKELEEPAWNGVRCVYFDAPSPPERAPWLILNGDDPGPVSHLCVPSQVAPGHAPAGRALVSVSVLGTGSQSDTDLAAAVQGQLKGWWGEPVSRWRLLGVQHVPHALPRQTPDVWDPVTRPVHVSDRLFVAGGHRETSSIGGAMRSGRRAARAVLDRLS